MTIRLESPEKSLEMSNRCWSDVFDLAAANGWVPAGTRPCQQVAADGQWLSPEQHESWCGTYFTNDGQVVTEADAAAMAEALDRACGERGQPATPSPEAPDLLGTE